MGKTRDTGFLNNCVFTDSSNNVGIGGAANASYKLAVTGTTLTTGAATFSSSITTGSMSISSSTIQNSGNFYIGTSAANFLQFYTNNTDRMVITSSGNVGIGTSSPSRRLTVPSDGSNWISGVFGGAGGTDVVVVGNLYGPTIGGHNSTLTAWAPLLLNPDGGRVGINTTSALAGGSLCINGNLDFGGTAGGNYRITNYQAGFLAFGTDNTERMRITSSGNVLIGTTTDLGSFLTIGGNSSTMRILPATDNVGYVGESTHRWAAIYAANGTIQTSDGREKKDITNSDLGLDFINSLRPVSYKWIVGENIVTYETIINEQGEEEIKEIITPREGKRTHYGFIAQEVKEIIGEKDFGGYVHDIETDKMSLRYDQFIAPLVKAIQELSAKVTALENK